jgi:hypothetical protein
VKPEEILMKERLSLFISEKKIIKLWYFSGDSRKISTKLIAEPYRVGINSLNGELQLKAWLIPVAAQVLTGEKPGWHLYSIARILKAEDTGKTYSTPRNGYTGQELLPVNGTVTKMPVPGLITPKKQKTRIL